MIRMVHFATRRDLIPLLQRYQVDPDLHWTWMRAPVWLRKMWDVANRERQRQRTARKGSPFQHWRFPPTLGLPRCIDVTNPTIWCHKKP